MRIPLIGAMLATAFLLPVTQAAAQSCGGVSTAPAMDHSAHAAPATAPAMKPGCCAAHTMTAPATPADAPVDHSAHAMPAAPATAPAMKAGCCASHKTAPATPDAPMACCNHSGAAMAMPADDPAVAMAGLGLVSPGPVFRGETSSHGVPVR